MVILRFREVRINRMNIKKWRLRHLDKECASEIISRYGISTISAIIMTSRNVTEDEKINEYLSDEYSLSNPYELPDMNQAVERIFTALENNEKIAIFGDYDTDGITASAILYKYFNSVGANVVYQLPEREGDGYGLSCEIIDSFIKQGVNLLITVDNGINSVEEVDYASKNKIDCIITDHHIQGGKLPNAVAVVDPFRTDFDNSTIFSLYSGAGIAYKLVDALNTEIGDTSIEDGGYLELAAIGTIGDYVSLTGENRTISKEGIKKINKTDNPGIKALIRAVKPGNETVSSLDVSYLLVPKINASGRMSSPETAFKLLTATDLDEAEPLAQEICSLNDKRKDLENTVYNEAIEIIENSEIVKYKPVIIVSKANWPLGIIGIVAAKLTEKYGKPSIVFSEGDIEAIGSARSVRGIDIYEALNACSGSIKKYGGHRLAAGLTCENKKINELTDELSDYIENKYEIIPSAEIDIDIKLTPSVLSPQIINDLQPLEPYGVDNPQPLIGLYSMKVTDITAVGTNQNHIRLKLSRDGTVITCMKFNTVLSDFAYSVGDVIDIAAQLNKNVYNSKVSLSVIIREMRLTGFDYDKAYASLLIYEKYKRGSRISKDEALSILPNRDDMASVYRYIRDSHGWNKSIYVLLSNLHNMDLGKFLVCDEILKDKNLINSKIKDDIYTVELIPVKSKVDIMASNVYEVINKLSI
jgi:single-stranded-DNA-specific exonuclease